MRTYQEIMDFIEGENVQFIRLAFFDIYGTQKNIAIMPGELRRALTSGISFYSGAIAGFGSAAKSDLFLHPDPKTLTLVPWRPMDGRVAKMFCDITYPDGTPFERDTRYLLKRAMQDAAAEGLSINFGPELEFYVFKLDENGNQTNEPIDHAGYMDVDPDDCGENIRRDICLTLQEMNITPETSHHEQGPGQNEVDFRYGNAIQTADNTSTFKWVVKSIARSNGCYVDFSPKPILNQPGNGMHINMSIDSKDGIDYSEPFMAGILHYIQDLTLFLNPVPASYERFGQAEAPMYISWSEQNRSQLIRIPAADSPRIELRSPDPTANPYLAYTLLIYAGLEGIKQQLKPGTPLNLNLFDADPTFTQGLSRLPLSIREAIQYASQSDFLKKYLPKELLDVYISDTASK